MNIKLFFAVVILSLAIPAAAEFEVISEAHEIRLSNFMAPATQNGGLSFKACSECETQAVRVTSNTKYSVNGKALRLDKFKQRLQPIRDRDAASVIVLHHLDSDTIVSVSVTY